MRARLAGTAALLVLCALASPSSGRGSEGTPDILDPPGDLSVTSFLYVSAPAPEIDLRAVWWNATDDAARVAWKVQDLGFKLQRDEDVSFALHGASDEYAWAGVEASSVWMGDAHAWFFWVSGCRESGPCDVTPATGVVDIEQDTVSVSFARGFFPSVVRCAQASSIVALADGGGAHSGGGPAWLRDYAPAPGACGPDMDFARAEP